MEPDLKVTLGPLVLKNPVMTASGTFGYGREYFDYVDPSELGAVVVKGLSLNPRLGNPPPRIMETAGGMLNAVGLQNIGVKTFIEEELPWLVDKGVTVIANIYGETIDEYCEVCELLCRAGGICAIEVNISCPNVQEGGILFGQDSKMAAQVTREVKKVSSLPVIVKLTPNVTDITEIALACEEAGADAVSLINTFRAMSIDVCTRKPHLGNVVGGLSGPAIKPIALRMVWETVRKVKIPVIGVGGISTVQDALEFLIAGAKAIQVGTANFFNPRATVEIIHGLKFFLKQEGFSSIGDIIGTFEEG
ncbi:MAG: dihydroorotate dehydrogenase [Syntrophales bacterium]|nr:dihydroorotate dehydrogenase [Syntrophales bacterium]